MALDASLDLFYSILSVTTIWTLEKEQGGASQIIYSMNYNYLHLAFSLHQMTTIHLNALSSSMISTICFYIFSNLIQ